MKEHRDDRGDDREREDEKEQKRESCFGYFVDDKPFEAKVPKLSGGEIMDRAGIPRKVGLLVCNADGTQEAVPADEVVHLVPCARFKKAPRFKRGGF